MEWLDFATLKVIWWGIVGLLLVGFAIMDGHDMGVGTLLPFVAKNDEQRRLVIATVGAHWEGNQVWFISAGGAVFAAWPLVYATAFSGFYWVMMAVLWALFLRPVGFKYRNLLTAPRWRFAWDWGLFVGSFVPPLIFGVAFGNLLLGVPFYFDSTLRSFYTGSFWALLNPFALLCGAVSVAMITLQGAVYLMHRTVDVIYQRARWWALGCTVLTLGLFSLAGLWVATIEGYVVVQGSLSPQAMANPLVKSVVKEAGAWLENYQRYPWMVLAPVLAYVGFVLAGLLVFFRRSLSAFVASSVGLLGVIVTAGVSMFPFILPSSSHLSSSLTLWDATSSRLTLLVMLFVVVVLLPIVVMYTSWAYAVMRGKVTAEFLKENSQSHY